MHRVLVVFLLRKIIVRNLKVFVLFSDGPKFILPRRLCKQGKVDVKIRQKDNFLDLYIVFLLFYNFNEQFKKQKVVVRD